MTHCQKCNSKRLLNVSSKANDCQHVVIGEKEHVGYLPRDLGIGGGDYIQLEFCLDCGQMQGKFPVPLTEMESE